MSIGWNFPSNNNGSINGISEAGIETFRGNPFGSLAKEICQNSLDAQYKSNKAVDIHFQLSEIDISKIDGFEDLFNAIKSCKNYWSHNKKTSDFFDKAIDICSKNKLKILRISDFNTSGLTGSKSEKPISSAWFNLVKSSGVSDKSGISGGSYGIGKSAPFACSDLRTVFYSTYDIEKIRAYQGVSKLVSFEVKDSDEKNQLTQGTGYYGETSNNSPIFDTLSIDGFKRKEPGTDVYILGFTATDSWKDDIIKSVLEGYLLSIKKGNITVKIDDVSINSENLEYYINKYKHDIPLAYNYYQVFTSENTIHIEENLQDLGKFSLYVLIEKDLRRQVMMSRSNGMKIFDKKNISSTIQFAGICILEDTKINEFFREMETPQHNNWEEQRHSEPKKAKKIKTELYRFIKDKVLEIGKGQFLDSMDAVGAGDFISDIDVDESLSKDEGESLLNKVSCFELKKVENIFVNHGEQMSEESEFDIEIESEGNLDEEGDKQVDNEYSNGKNNSSSSNNPNDYNENSNASENEEGDINLNKSIGIKPLKLRIYMCNKEKEIYKLIFVPEKDAQKAYIEISLSGEQKKSQTNIISALSNNFQDLKFEKNRIYLDTISKNDTYTIFYSIDYKGACSMEVAVYGYKI